MIRAALAVAAVLVVAGCMSSGPAASSGGQATHGGNPTPATTTTVSQAERVRRYVALVNAALPEALPATELIADGKTYCLALRTKTETYPSLLAKIDGLATITHETARIFLQLAIITFCPDQKPPS